MDKRTVSKLKNEQKTNKLQSLSPQKFGKNAANLSYTPSKLADNLIYKDASSMKKNEESSSKVRQSQALNGILKQKVRHLQQQRNGIQQTLNQQIAMYKKMNRQLQSSHQARIKELQKAFTDEINKIILDKQQEAKYVQAQKQLMENRIFQLQTIIAQMKEQFGTFMADLQKQTSQNDKLVQNINKLTSKSAQLQSIRKEDNQRYKKQVQKLKNTIQEQSKEHKAELEKQKQKIAKMLTQKQSSAAQIANLKTQQSKLKEALEKTNIEANKAKDDLKRLSNNSTQTTVNFQRTIEDLKKKMQENQKKFLQQKSNWGIQGRQLREQILILRKNVQKSGILMNQNNYLSQQVKRLQELLVESCRQMQRCKIEFARQDVQKQSLFQKLSELDLQNQTLYKLKHQMEDQAKCWRQAYYKSRR